MSELYYKSKSSPCLFSLPALNIGPRAMHRQPQASGRKNILSSNPPSHISREDLLQASLCTSQEFSPAICFISWPYSPKRMNFVKVYQIICNFDWTPLPSTVKQSWKFSTFGHFSYFIEFLACFEIDWWLCFIFSDTIWTKLSKCKKNIFSLLHFRVLLVRGKAFWLPGTGREIENPIPVLREGNGN